MNLEVQYFTLHASGHVYNSTLHLHVSEQSVE